MREIITTTAEDGTETEQILDFRYDNAGLPYALHYKDDFEGIEQTYYYVTNLQGDVMYIVDESGNEVASYDYDPYGKLLRTTGNIAEANPLRYRGYYYDTETDFYYLQSRYYDPAVCRFINCDGFTTTGQGLLGYNMFSYCGNNPIVYADGKGSVRIAVIYDATLTKHNAWGTDGLGMLFFGNGSWPFFTMEGHSFTTDDEFVECWNSLQGEYDEIYIYAHGSFSTSSIWFQTEDNYLGNTDNDKRNYSYDVLNPVKVNKLVTLCVCNAAKEHDGVSTAQVFADLTSCEVKATKGKVKTTFIFGIGVPEKGYSWERIQPNTSNSCNDYTSNNDASRCGGGTRFNMRY